MRLPLLSAGVFLAFATGSIAAIISADGPARFDDLVQQGRAAFLVSDLDRAESAYNEACPASVIEAYPVTKAVTCENLLASVDEVRGNLVRAGQRFLQAVTRAEQAGTAYQPLYCAKLIDLGGFLHRRGRIAEAEASLRKASDLARQMTVPFPELLPKALVRLGSLYADSPHPESGRAPLMEALTLGGLPENEMAIAQNAIGKIDLAAGNPKAAESHLREAASLAASSLGEDHLITTGYRINLAKALIAERQFDRARLLLRRAQFVLESRPDKSAAELAVVCLEMSDVASGQGKLGEAADYAQRAISILSLQTIPDAGTIATAQVILAGIYVQANDTDSAERLLPLAIEGQRAAAVSPGTLALSLQLLGRIRVRQRNWAAAEASYREAISLCRADVQSNFNRAIPPLLLALADVLRHEAGSKEEIRALETQAREILRSTQTAAQSGTVKAS